MLLQACPMVKQHYDFTTMDKTFIYAAKEEALTEPQNSALVSHENTPLRQNYVPCKRQLPALVDQPSDTKEEPLPTNTNNVLNINTDSFQREFHEYYKDVENLQM
jgi:hypothetical protein